MAEPEPAPIKLSALNAGDKPTDLEGMLARIESSASIIHGWDAGRQKRVKDLRDAIENLHAEAMRRLIRGLRNVPEANVALRDMLKDEVVYSVLRRLGVVRASLNERIDQAITGLRPQLEAQQASVEIVEFLPPDGVRLRWIGSCFAEGATGRSLREKIVHAVQAACPELQRFESATEEREDAV